MHGLELKTDLQGAAAPVEWRSYLSTENGRSEKRLDVTPDLTNKSIVSV